MGEKTDFSPKMAFCLQGFRLCGGDQRAMKTGESAIALWKPSAPPLLGFHVCWLIMLHKERKAHQLKMLR